jgi:3-hydroxybutyryl-CoA dehydratase
MTQSTDTITPANLSYDSNYLEDLKLGDQVERDFEVNTAAIMAFAEVSHDHNPVHVDEAYAATTAFKGPIAHGMLMGAFISATLAGALPGRGAVYVGQSLNFKRAVRPGDKVTVVLTITYIDLKSAHVKLSTVVKLKNKTMVDGVAEVIAARRPQ